MSGMEAVFHVPILVPQCFLLTHVISRTFTTWSFDLFLIRNNHNEHYLFHNLFFLPLFITYLDFFITISNPQERRRASELGFFWRHLPWR
ncbi:uncharacterized protein B0T23DRAFT_228854 [Neurospora hispaniola]|uniref:Uncharacterized protein n=1 Tax=Neurospora hispaniola TaxID=588809 RepID=A0AAJ0I0D2_9PEZI|nr:hypothetical protein B0T23DRAFT_228854 [Neurospora hispaniola]